MKCPDGTKVLLRFNPRNNPWIITPQHIITDQERTKILTTISNQGHPDKQRDLDMMKMLLDLSDRSMDNQKQTIHRDALTSEREILEPEIQWTLTRVLYDLRDHQSLGEGQPPIQGVPNRISNLLLIFSTTLGFQSILRSLAHYPFGQGPEALVNNTKPRLDSITTMTDSKSGTPGILNSDFVLPNCDLHHPICVLGLDCNLLQEPVLQVVVDVANRDAEWADQD